MNNPLYDTPNQKIPDTGVPEKPVSFFHLVAALAIYTKDGAAKQRHVNIMLETASPHVVRKDLDQVNQGVLSRVNTENDVQPEDLKDIVILNICRLAVTDRDTFYGFSMDEAQAESDAPVQ